MNKNIEWDTSLNNKNLELILFVTEACNFRCAYCYEDFKLGKIAFDVIEGIKKVITKRINGLELLTLSYFGGEPLLNKRVVYETSNWAAKLCKTYNVIYHGSITTNGYLLDKNTLDKLIPSEVTTFQITLDGEKQTHNKLRPTSKGGSTFDKIYSNIIMMSKTNYNFRCMLRFNVADTNYNSIKTFINDYTSPFTSDKRFSFHFNPIFGMSKFELAKKELLEDLKELVKIKGFQHDTKVENHLCYASKANSFIIRADGRIQKCTVSLDSEINNIGKIDKNGNLNIDLEKFKKWIFAVDKECPSRILAIK